MAKSGERASPDRAASVRMDSSPSLGRRRLIQAIVGLGVLPVSGCARRQGLLRFRLNLQFVVGSRVVKSSSVRETWWTEDPAWFPSDGAPNSGWRGEATVTDLGDERFIVAMLDGYTNTGSNRERSYGPWSPATVLMGRFTDSLPRDQLGRVDWGGVTLPTFEELHAQLSNEPLILQPEELPVLVAFATPQVPGSGLVIQPAEISQIFPDVRLGLCTTNLTRNPVKFGRVEEALPWVRDRPGKATQYTPPNQAGRVMTQDFQRR